VPGHFLSHVISLVWTSIKGFSRGRGDGMGIDARARRADKHKSAKCKWQKFQNKALRIGRRLVAVSRRPWASLLSWLLLPLSLSLECHNSHQQSQLVVWGSQVSIRYTSIYRLRQVLTATYKRARGHKYWLIVVKKEGCPLWRPFYLGYFVHNEKCGYKFS